MKVVLEEAWPDEWFGVSGTPVDVPNNDELPGRPH
jgi:hypothetical protein